MTTHKELRDSRKGHTIWYLTTVEYVGTRRNLYKFLCRCGNEVVASWQKVTKGDVKSCGCWKKGRPVTQGTLAPDLAVYHRYRLSAKRRNIAFDLTQEQVANIIHKDCHYCGSVPKTTMKLSAHPNYLYSGIDRINNELGYFLGNVVSCCLICNRAKNTMSYTSYIDWLSNAVAYATKDRSNNE